MTFTLPRRYQNLTKTNKITYKGNNLLTIYLVHLIDYIIREYTYDDLTVPLYSVVMKQIYGNQYSGYVEYLVDTVFIKEVKGYSTVKHTSTLYKLTDDLKGVFIHRKDDYKLKKKLTRYFENHNPIFKKSPIPMEIRQKLVDDLKSVTIDYERSVKYLEKNLKKNRGRYPKNLSMINKIKNHDIFFSFDNWGRFHSNFTNLNKEIRTKYLTIDGQPLVELDIKSSQPFFLSQVMKRDPLLSDNEEVKRFIDILEDSTQDIYRIFVKKYPEYFTSKDEQKNRNKSKLMVLKSLFNRKKNMTKYKEIFKREYPFIFDYMNMFKYDSFQELWLTLQRMESEFIFNKVYMSVIKQIPEIKIITVHDSILYPMKYHEKVKPIWETYRQEMISKK
jgi:hypothetical protein